MPKFVELEICDNMIMKKILTTLAATAMIAGTAFAQINNPDTKGYISRAERMMAEGNYKGVIDQVRQAAGSLTLTDEEATKAEYIRCRALLQLNDASGPEAMKKFISDNKGTASAIDATMLLADYYFHNAKYADAHSLYADIRRSQLSRASADDLTFRDGFCLLRLGETDLAESKFNALAMSKKYSQASVFYRGYIAYSRNDYRQARTLLNDVNSPELKAKADYYLTQIDFIDGNYLKVVNRAASLLNDNSVAEFHNEILRLRGESNYYLGNENDALKDLRQYAFSEENPQPSALYILGVSEYRAGNYDDAIGHLGKVVDQQNAIGQSAYLHIGQSCLKIGRKDAAVMSFEKAYRMNFDRNVQSTAFYNYAVAQLDGGRTPFGGTVSVFEDFLQNFPDSPHASEVEEYLITGYMIDNDYENALRSINRVENPSSKILAAKQRVLFTLGTREVATGNITSALSRFTQARAIDGADAVIANECDLWIGECLYRQGNYTKASEALNDYINSKSTTNRSLAFYDLGYAQFKRGKYSDAAKAFSNAIKAEPKLSASTSADVFNRLGDCACQNRNFADALKNYDKAIAADNAAGDYALLQKAVVYDNTSRQADAVATIDHLTKEYPASALIPEALLLKAECYASLNNNAKAVDTYDQIVDSYGATAQGRNALLQRAITLQNSGNKTRAIEDYRKLVEQYPTSDEAKVAVDDLKRIYADDGQLGRLADIINAIPNAPRFEKSEMDQLSFDAAEKSYLANGSTQRLSDYINQYDKGVNTDKALNYLMKAAEAKGDKTKALAYASRLVDEYPDADATEDALATKGRLLAAKGDLRQALATYNSLAAKAKSPAAVSASLLEALRLENRLGNDKEMVKTADKILASSATSSDVLPEVRYLRAKALYNTGNTDEAVAEYQLLARDINDYYGAAAGVAYAEHLYNTGANDQAERAAYKLISPGTPHNYWLARACIVLSDALRKKGKTFDADEYLRNVRDNYPGSEPDITEAINARLK